MFKNTAVWLLVEESSALYSLPTTKVQVKSKAVAGDAAGDDYVFSDASFDAAIRIIN